MACVLNDDSHNSSEYIGEREIWGGKEPFGIPFEDRRQHLYCLGKSGTGKTTLLRNLLLHDIEAGRGVGLIDVHGDLAHEILDYIPGRRTDDVVYFRPGDTAHPIGLNLFHGITPETRHVVASNIVGAFKSIWRHSWGVRLEYVLYAAIAALLESEGSTLLGLQRILVDPEYRTWIVRNLSDPMLRVFWLHEFARWDPKLRNEIISPVQNKVGQLLMTPVMRNVLGQVRRKIDFRFMMDTNRIFIANLQKAELGEDKANLLGSLIIAAMQYASLGRGDVPESERPQFCLYIDEFQNFQTHSFSTILSEARKYGLSLVLSHQFSRQLEDDIADAVFGNVGTIISFRVGYADAERLSAEFGGTFSPSQLASLDNHHICARLMKGGNLPEPFLAKTLPPQGKRYGRRENILSRSREKYGVHREIVEDKIRRWTSSFLPL